MNMFKTIKTLLAVKRGIEEVSMDNTKKWYASVTLWSGLVMALSLMLQFAGYADITPDEQQQLTDNAINLSVAIAQITAVAGVIWGRLRAKSQIK